MADAYNTFYVVFWNNAIDEYYDIFQRNVDQWISIEDFTVTHWMVCINLTQCLI